jgi:hypothetical protein
MLLFFQLVVIMALCLITFAMRKVCCSSVLAVAAFRSISGKAFLTRRSSGSALKTAPTAELIR